MYYPPAEWDEHAGTILVWPQYSDESEISALLAPWVFVEVIRLLSRREKVFVLCNDSDARVLIAEVLDSVGALNPENCVIAGIEHSYPWVRDSGPTAVFDADDKPHWISWRKPSAVSESEGKNIDEILGQLSSWEVHNALIGDDPQTPFKLEGGAFDSNGKGTLLVTEERFRSERGETNVLSKGELEKLFFRYLGAETVLWVPAGLIGDKTFGHVDNVARFINETTVVVAVELDTSSQKYDVTRRNIEYLKNKQTADGRSLDVIELPLPSPIVFQGEYLPASYTNFYMANGLMIVPTFNDARDIDALNILRSALPDREIVGVHCRELIIGGGALHCVTQPLPKDRRSNIDDIVKKITPAA